MAANSRVCVLKIYPSAFLRIYIYIYNTWTSIVRLNARACIKIERYRGIIRGGEWQKSVKNVFGPLFNVANRLTTRREFSMCIPRIKHLAAVYIYMM